MPTTNTRGKKRLGRGYGSGKGGHTSSRGHKGQRSRGSIGLFFQGAKSKKSLIIRLPLMRGKGKLAPRGRRIAVDLKELEVFKKDELVNLESLIEKGILSKKLPSGIFVKILGNTDLGVPLKVALPVSKTAEEKIEKAGGKVIKPGSEKEIENG